VSDAPLLAVHNATRRFGAVTALDGVSLQLDAGEVLACWATTGPGSRR
jgi:ABC-type sugar transport system ATPase subunit